MSEEAKKHLSEYWKGKKKTKQHAENIRKSKLGSKNPNFGKKLTPEQKNAFLNGRRGKAPWNKGKKCPQLATNWQGGKSTENHLIRHSIEYRQWRKAVFERDDYTCVFCGLKFIKGVTGNVILHADHIKQFAFFPELRLDVDNGRTLCIDCHKKTPTYKNKNRELVCQS